MSRSPFAPSIPSPLEIVDDTGGRMAFDFSPAVVRSVLASQVEVESANEIGLLWLIFVF